MSGIVLSLPVHERPDMVRDQLENIRFFCPEATVVLHVSQGATAPRDEFLRQCDMPNVIINPRSLETVWGHGILHTHIANFEHASELGLDFDKIAMISSNEMLVKPGLAAHIHKHELGAQTEIFDWVTDWHLFKQEMLDDPRVKLFLGKLGLPLFFGGQAEGQFFTREAFGFMARLYQQVYPMGPCGFVTEEMIPPTIAAYLCLTGKTAALPFTLCDYCLNIQVNSEIVDHVRRENGALMARRIPRTLRSPHVGSSVLNQVFSIKRVPREPCELRSYIRGLEHVPAA